MWLPIIAWVWLNDAAIPADAHLSTVIFWGPVLHFKRQGTPDNKVHRANMWPIWVLSALDGPHVGPTNLAIRDADRKKSGLVTQWSGSSFFCKFVLRLWLPGLILFYYQLDPQEHVWVPFEKKTIIFSQGNALVTGVRNAFYILFWHPPDYVAVAQDR